MDGTKERDQQHWRNSEASSISNDKFILILANSFIARPKALKGLSLSEELHTAIKL